MAFENWQWGPALTALVIAFGVGGWTIKLQTDLSRLTERVPDNLKQQLNEVQALKQTLAELKENSDKLEKSIQRISKQIEPQIRNEIGSKELWPDAIICRLEKSSGGGEGQETVFYLTHTSPGKTYRMTVGPSKNDYSYSSINSKASPDPTTLASSCDGLTMEELIAKKKTYSVFREFRPN